ncbi:anaerobic ribonucleoside-triphosphate reductase activating protein [Parabacteroides sp. PF5-9]|uniref:anaerobic ribonucleoside-triphosphate reductase activating protein n=1 Tax=Parabacteroides sp. PF5-9 TaxID=1742404 RepID=UPI0024755462|nr:anaerobic ribonucleoside-triphosphate reductase activating protein [Parabacteroides sp. PF5-9]MDH6356526.1 anaerobic ribonucleoside-triphosphate reductase activating protein [Parabacteroides sp. PF5-9]
MLRFTSYDIVFQEIPNEVTLAINLSNCPNRCKGCHSAHLMRDTGEILNRDSLDELFGKYKNAITCICFMGGDAAPHEVESLSVYLRKQSEGKIKTGWYSGKKELPEGCSLNNFNYIKLGPYIERLGGLDSPHTNQRFYRIEENRMIDMTSCFQKPKNLRIQN